MAMVILMGTRIKAQNYAQPEVEAGGESKGNC
jgi:hypothetical protein